MRELARSDCLKIAHDNKNVVNCSVTQHSMSLVHIVIETGCGDK